MFLAHGRVNSFAFENRIYFAISIVQHNHFCINTNKSITALEGLTSNRKLSVDYLRIDLFCFSGKFFSPCGFYVTHVASSQFFKSLLKSHLFRMTLLDSFT